jgi:hypothetical protein
MALNKWCNWTLLRLSYSYPLSATATRAIIYRKIWYSRILRVWRPHIINGELEGSIVGSSVHAVFHKLLTNQPYTEKLYWAYWESVLLWKSAIDCNLLPLPHLFSPTTIGPALLYHASRTTQNAYSLSAEGTTAVVSMLSIFQIRFLLKQHIDMDFI